MRKFIIERDIPAVGGFEREQLRAAAQKSNEVLAELGYSHDEVNELEGQGVISLQKS